MDRVFLVCAAVFGFVGVAAGAFGAHALRGKLGRDRVATFEVGARYLLYGAFSLMAVEWFRAAGPDQVAESWAGICFVAGTALFGGSLFALSLSGSKRWGAVTPVGGVLLLIGWALLLVAAATAPLRFAVFR